jgi:hypothetical protein
MHCNSATLPVQFDDFYFYFLREGVTVAVYTVNSSFKIAAI